ncbi:MAG: hypothetical protein EBX13_02835 [Proteobacteria bacterium]|nr:hypothetical protein [Pseudomonadota bacterium]
MERQLLTSFIFLLFSLQSCQTFEVVNEPESNKDISLISEKEVIIKPEPSHIILFIMSFRNLKQQTCL